MLDLGIGISLTKTVINICFINETFLNQRLLIYLTVIPVRFNFIPSGFRLTKRSHRQLNYSSIAIELNQKTDFKQMPMKSVQFCFTGWRTLKAVRWFQLQQSHDAELTGQVLVTLIIVFYKNAIACFILFRRLVKGPLMVRGVSSLATGYTRSFWTDRWS